jgi:hypothetical protein
MPRVLGLLLTLVALTSVSSASADVVVPSSVDQPVEPAAPEPASASRGTLVHKPVLAGLIALLFLVMGGVAANDHHKKSAKSKRG